MTKLSDTQAIILSPAAQREDRIAPPLPESLRGAAAAKVVGSMLAKGFLEEVDADMRKGEPITIRAGTKRAQIIALLQRPEGASIAEIVEATSWQPHTARGMISGAPTKKLRRQITFAADQGRGTVHRIA